MQLWVEEGETAAHEGWGNNSGTLQYGTYHSGKQTDTLFSLNNNNNKKSCALKLVKHLAVGGFLILPALKGIKKKKLLATPFSECRGLYETLGCFPLSLQSEASGRVASSKVPQPGSFPSLIE